MPIDSLEEEPVTNHTQVEDSLGEQKMAGESYYDFVVDYVAYNSYDGGFDGGWFYHHGGSLDEEPMEDTKADVDENPVGNGYGHDLRGPNFRS